MGYGFIIMFWSIYATATQADEWPLIGHSLNHQKMIYLCNLKYNDDYFGQLQFPFPFTV